MDIHSKVKRMTDSELSYAMNDIRETMKHHVFGSPYHNQLMREYDAILERMSKNCVTEYLKRHEIAEHLKDKG